MAAEGRCEDIHIACVEMEASREKTIRGKAWGHILHPWSGRLAGKGPAA